MRKILISDCNHPVIDALPELMGKTAQVVKKPFTKGMDIREFALVLLEMDRDRNASMDMLKHLRYAARFRNIPILPMQSQGAANTFAFPFSSALRNRLPLEYPPAAVAQILEGYLMPGRLPKDTEMQYLTPFIESTQKVFSTMASMEVSCKQIYFKSDYNILGDVSGVIGLSGNADGMVVITFYWDLAQEIISRIMGVEQDTINPELINDGVGELINMISGAAKRYLVETPYYFQLSIPTVFVGWQHEVGHPEKASVAVMVFDFEDKSFALQVSLIAKPSDET
jgi:chemotaxis protein CheX